jgi:hypothetical protein
LLCHFCLPFLLFVISDNRLTHYLILGIFTVVVCDFCISNWLFRPDVNPQTTCFAHSL